MENNIEIYSDIELDIDLTPLVKKALEIINPPFPASVSITLTNNEEIQTINKEQRQMDKPTDVLSFPMLFWQSPEVLETPLSDCDYDISTGFACLGDIIISTEKAAQQAKEYGHSFKREFFYLTVHGLLHLFGYDHIEENDKAVMRKKEEQILEECSVVSCNAAFEDSFILNDTGKSIDLSQN